MKATLSPSGSISRSTSGSTSIDEAMFAQMLWKAMVGPRLEVEASMALRPYLIPLVLPELLRASETLIEINLRLFVWIWPRYST